MSGPPTRTGDLSRTASPRAGPTTVASAIRSEIEAVENDSALWDEAGFRGRAEAIERLEFDVIDRIEGLLRSGEPPAELGPLRRRAERVKRGLERVDDRLFRRLRAGIRAGRCSGAALEALIDHYVGRGPGGHRRQDETGYDGRDVFINGLLLIGEVPAETRAREPEMVFYQQTPARIILELVERARLTREDVFYDLGSGLGQLPILVNLLSGARARGVELEPAYCEFARACAAELRLPGVEFINEDARAADYSAGTVFFMYTPFEGRMLQAVLDALRDGSRRRRIRLFTYGPCTPHVARQSWLECVDGDAGDVHRLGAFRSV